MTILVIGKGGQLSTALEEAAPTRGHRAVLLGPPELDLAAPEAALGVFTAALDDLQPDIVINAAAYTAVDKAEDEEDLALAVNATAPALLAGACAARSLGFLHVSTDYVYSGDKTGPYVETDPTGPTGAYGRTKLAGEAAIQAAHQNALIFRTAWVYSPFGNNFVRTMLRLTKDRDALGIVADQRGCPTYAPDIASVLLDVAAVEAPAPGVYHLAGHGDIDWCGFAAEIFRLSAAAGGPSAVANPITSAEYPTPARRPANSVLDCSKLQKTFGLTVPNWQDSLDRCITRLKDAGDL